MRGSPSRASAFRLFDQPNVKSKLPDPTLRAAFAALRGTIAEPVIDEFLSRVDFSPPRFGGISDQGLVAMATPVGGKPQIVFNGRYLGESFALLIGFVAHEILHHDAANSPTEEAILNGLTTLLHMQVLARHPELGTSGTELSRQANDLVLFFLNSRVPGSPRSVIVAPRGRGTAPGSARSTRDFLAVFSKDGGLAGSAAKIGPASAASESVLRRVVVPGVSIPKPLTYSKKTAELFSTMNDNWLSPVDRLRVSVLLGLLSLDEITKHTRLTHAKAIATFRLAPILTAMR